MRGAPRQIPMSQFEYGDLVEVIAMFSNPYVNPELNKILQMTR